MKPEHAAHCVARIESVELPCSCRAAVPRAAQVDGTQYVSIRVGTSGEVAISSQRQVSPGFGSASQSLSRDLLATLRSFEPRTGGPWPRVVSLQGRVLDEAEWRALVDELTARP